MSVLPLVWPRIITRCVLAYHITLGLASDWLHAETDKYQARLALAEKAYLDKLHSQQ